MHSHDCRAQTHRPHLMVRCESSCSEADERKTKPGAVITAQDVSGERLQKQEMRVNVVQSGMKGDIRSAVLEPPPGQDKDEGMRGGGGANIRQGSHGRLVSWSTEAQGIRSVPGCGSDGKIRRLADTDTAVIEKTSLHR